MDGRSNAVSGGGGDKYSVSISKIAGSATDFISVQLGSEYYSSDSDGDNFTFKNQYTLAEILSQLLITPPENNGIKGFQFSIVENTVQISYVTPM